MQNVKMAEKVKVYIVSLVENLYERRKLLLALSCIVVFVMSYILILPAFTLDKEEAAEQGGIDLPASEQSIDDDSASEVKPSGEITLRNECKDAYSIAVEGNDSVLSENMSIRVREIDPGSRKLKREYDSLYNDALEAVQKEESEDKSSEFAFAKFYDISLMDGKKEVEPGAAVDVKISFSKDIQKELQVADPGRVYIVHFAVDKETGEVTPEVLDTDSTDITVENNKVTEAAFTADSFSVFAVVYTVDFHYGADGRQYDFSMNGGDSVSLGKLTEELGITAESATDNIMSTSGFLDQVESVEFSDPELMYVGLLSKDCTAADVMKENGLHVVYPLGLSQKEVLKINHKKYNAGEWLLISIKPFDTEEILTITLKDGTVIEITVTDAQDAQMDGDKVQTITNPAGTTIDLFDYWIVRQDLVSREGWGDLDQGQGAAEAHDGQVNGTGNNKGINSSTDDPEHGHALKFSPAWAGTVFNGNKIGETGNAWESINMDGRNGLNCYTGNGDPFQGIVTDTLVNDYPQLTENSEIGANGESLGYLFDPGTEHDGKASYPGVNQLLYVDREGYYTYDSRDYAAAFDTSSKTFTVTEQTSNNSEIRGFWPFGTQNFWTGMHINTEFSVPQNGKVLNPLGEYKDMQFEFSGDDDTWIYVDGVLVGDGGGIHNRSEIDINFASGKVTVTGKKDSVHPGGFEETRYLDDIFKAAGKFDQDEWEPIPGDESHQRFKANTYHTFDMFYLERGGGESNLYIHYNLVSTTDFTAHKSFNGQDSTDVLKRDQFQFELIGFDGRYDTDGNPVSGYENEHAIMPNNGSEDGEGTVASPKKTHEDGSPGYTRLLTGDTEDGNVNFGNIDVNEFQNGYTYRYMVREIIPDDAVNADGVKWENATDEQKAAGGFTKDQILYDTRVYYFTKTVRPVAGVAGKYEMRTTRYTDSSYTIIDTETKFNSFENSFKPEFGDVQFTKINIGREPLSGAEFSLFRDEQCTVPAINVDGDKQAWKAVSGADGIVSFNDVRTGTYYMKETAAPEGYALDYTVYKVVITNKNDQSKESTITINGDESEEAVHSVINTPEGEIKVVKKWLNSSGNEIDGGNKIAKLKLYRKTDDSDIAEPATVKVSFHRDGASWDLDCGGGSTSVIVESATSFEITWHLGNDAAHILHDMKVNGILINQPDELVDLGIAKVNWIPWDGTTSRLIVSDIREDLNIEYNSNCDWFSEKPKVINIVPYIPPHIDTTPVFVESFVLDSQNSFNKTWETGGTLSDHNGYDLPATDDDGYRYLYFVKETDADGNEIEIGGTPAEGYYLSGYSYNNSTGISDQGVIFVYNKAEEPETIDVVIKKTDDEPESTNYLEGAVFQLNYRQNTGSEWIKANTVQDMEIPELDNDSRFTVPKTGIKLTGLIDGQYQLEEIVSPAGYIIIWSAALPLLCPFLRILLDLKNVELCDAVFLDP